MSGLLKSMPWASNRWPVLFGSPGGGRGWHGLLAKRSLDEVGEKESGLGWRERAGHRPFLRSSLTKEADKNSDLAARQRWRCSEGRISLAISCPRAATTR